MTEKKLQVDGKEYRVVEDLPYRVMGLPAAVVLCDGDERVVVRRSGQWRFWTLRDSMPS